jgi:hypothetical protein
MHLFRTFEIALLILLSMAHVCLAEPRSREGATSSPTGGWKPLFDGKSLNGWYLRIGNQKKNDEDPTKIFQVHDGLIHVYKDQAAGSPVPNGYLATNEDYAFYDFRLEYKWGEKKFKPRAEGSRDAGILYHLLRPDVVWPRSIECQIQEKDVGDCFTVRGSRVVTSVESIELPRMAGKKFFRYAPEEKGGKVQIFGHGGIERVIKSKTQEKDGWNTVEVKVRGSEGSTHIVNGHVVFEAKDLQQQTADKKKWEPLGYGRIAIQCEYAELFYRNIEIRAVKDGPLHPAVVRNER